ncbi:MAG: DUF1329 domain-containing protein [Deltaproteobacteria bacterium]|nr:DUF1329 domain-containing protein [Deltaproteobacteria bacterium]
MRIKKPAPLIVGMIVTACLTLLLGHYGDTARAGEVEFTSENWTETTAFAPDTASLESAIGKKITAGNVEKYKNWIPNGMKMLVKKYALILRITGYKPVHPSEGYIEATNKHRGKAEIIKQKSYKKRGIKGHVAGLPFPGPKTGLEVAWNHQYSYRGDDGEVYYSVYWISEKRGVEHTEEWRLAMIKGANRTDIDPRPSIESFKEKGLQGAGLTYALAPYDKKGFGAVYFRSIKPKSGQGHIYVPSMRRILRNSFGTRGDTWNSTDLLYEDVRGYSGYPEWMKWRLLSKKTMLLPMHSGVKLGKKGIEKAYDLKKWPYWNPKYKYEPRPVYVLEVKPKLPDYPYSKQYLYVDAETFAVLYKESYDKKGALWKIMINSAAYHPDVETDEEVLGWSGTVVIDLQAEHATVFHVHKARVNVGLKPSMFSLSNLRKRGR